MIASGGLVPHPPLLVPEVGRNDLNSVAGTVSAVRKLADALARENPDILIMSSPHHQAGRSGNIAVITSESLSGDFSRFGASDVKVNFSGAPDFAKRILSEIKGYPLKESSSSELDWGYTVFLSYAKNAGLKSSLLPLAISWGNLKDCYQLGIGIAGIARSYDGDLKVAYVASGDLSHCTRQQPTREYDPYGAVFDESIVDAVKQRNPSLLLEHKEADLIRARQCGACSFAVAMGFYEGNDSKWRFLSYEDPFGVGYLVAHFEVK
jgi:MEMO1 family protein